MCSFLVTLFKHLWMLKIMMCLRFEHVYFSTLLIQWTLDAFIQNSKVLSAQESIYFVNNSACFSELFLSTTQYYIHTHMEFEPC